MGVSVSRCGRDNLSAVLSALFPLSEQLEEKDSDMMERHVGRGQVLDAA